MDMKTVAKFQEASGDIPSSSLTGVCIHCSCPSQCTSKAPIRNAANSAPGMLAAETDYMDYETMMPARPSDRVGHQYHLNIMLLLFGLVFTPAGYVCSMLLLR